MIMIALAQLEKRTANQPGDLTTLLDSMLQLFLGMLVRVAQLQVNAG